MFSRLYLILGDAVETQFDNNIGIHVLEKIETTDKLAQLSILEMQLEDWRLSLPAWLGSCISNPDNLTTLNPLSFKLSASLSLRYHICVTLIHRLYFTSELARTVPLEGYFPSPEGRTETAIAVAHASVRTTVEATTRIIRLITQLLKSKDFGAGAYPVYYTFQAAVLLLASAVLSHRSQISCWGKTPAESIAHSRRYIQQALEILSSVSVGVPIAFESSSILQKFLTRFGQYWLHANDPRHDGDTDQSDAFHYLTSLANSSGYTNGARDLESGSINDSLDDLLKFDWEKLFGELPVI